MVPERAGTVGSYQGAARALYVLIGAPYRPIAATSQKIILRVITCEKLVSVIDLNQSTSFTMTILYDRLGPI